MNPRKLADNVFMLGAQDWDRRLFDALIALPDGTSYNSYVVKGSEKTVLLDTVDPTKTDILMSQLDHFPSIDYVIAHHVEQDHSGSLPVVLERYPQAQVLISTKGKELLLKHLPIDESRVTTVADGETLSLGDRQLEFVYIPWAHWPETMATYLPDEKIMFTCDLFGSHLATSEISVKDKARLYEADKRYYAEIMQPFRRNIARNVEKVKAYGPKMIAPSHGPVHDTPDDVIRWHEIWTADEPENLVVIPYVTMHGSTERMVQTLAAALIDRGVTVELFNMTVADLGRLAATLVDAATIVLATPTILSGPHPSIAHAAFLANALKPKARYASIIGSYGWGGRAVDALTGLIPNLKVELLEPVLCRGLPGEADTESLEALATTIHDKHAEIGLL